LNLVLSSCFSESYQLNLVRKMFAISESTVEEAALSWFRDLGYAIGHGPHMALGEPRAGRDLFNEVVLVARLREANRQLSD